MRATIEVLEGGLYTTVQDYPGRTGYWGVGIPPSGPMDSFAFRVANALVANPDTYAALEITAMGPKLAFHDDALIALTGARLQCSLDQDEVAWWQAIEVPGGSVLTLKGLQGDGFRAYLAIAGGIDVPLYLGSRSTFPFGHFGGYEGRPLQKGDVLKSFGASASVRARSVALPDSLRPHYSKVFEVGAIPGPQEAPDFFTLADVEMFYESEWTVHYNSNRLGYRLVGPRPDFAREDGGEGGRHPSNIPDTPYSVGMVNFTGDMPIVLTADGPSLGGFVCMATVATTELWKIGQAMPGNKLRFRRTTIDEAVTSMYELQGLLSGIY
ncbi:MAG TPA: 5-oxoprolinase/urea amidolyase family protein [Thermoleophilia bacterium]|nr:5-oxoprolinase/urea amidolyase family protein [Thermoleophilia bacterium]